MKNRIQLLTLVSLLFSLAGFPQSALATIPAARAASSRAVMSGEQVIQILDETVDWYRTLGAQQQSANQPSDLLIVYANRQTADQVIGLAFDIARANAELLSSEAETAIKTDDVVASTQALNGMRQKLEAQRMTTQAEMDTNREALARAPKTQGGELQAKINELQGELDLINARRNLLDTMTQFVGNGSANSSGASALKSHIDAIAMSIPAASLALAPPTSAAPNASAGSAPLLSSTTAPATGPSRFGIWDLATNVLRLSDKLSTISTIDRRTAELQATFQKIRTAPLDQLKSLSARGDALAAQADSANSAALKSVRDQFDTLAWLFKQTSSILIPLSKEGVLLQQYRHNLSNWRDTVKNQYHDALKVLGIRLSVLAALLLAVFGAAELWRRAVFRYAHEPRRRYQLLLLRKITLWTLVVAIVGATFATELSSFVTFAGLLTAGLAVAMQSVLVSVVGYFFLIGKFGIRVGDRVQIGNVTGEVIDLGLVRMHLMELSGQGPLGPTGRVVAFANSIVFQASGGLFKQIPGVNLAWHEITVKLPDGCDYSAAKEKLLQAAERITGDYDVELARQTKEIDKTSASRSVSDAKPQVQLHFSGSGVEALVRYPVHLEHAAEIDERVSRELFNVVAAIPAAIAREA